MTYHNKYEFRSLNISMDGLTLYEAMKVLESFAKHGHIKDSTRITSAGRFVAFYCLHRGEVRAAYQASPQEREVIN